jgi:hypothetical protein
MRMSRPGMVPVGRNNSGITARMACELLGGFVDKV